MCLWIHFYSKRFYPDISRNSIGDDNIIDSIIDCFAGGGGASVGIEMALGRPVDIAINHDPDAILMHKTNHPDISD